MAKYDPKKIEKKWQKKWLDEKVFKTGDQPKNKYYQLETFPYPSAAGLHVGHPKGYIAEDIHARYMRMNGCDVLYTMGWDAFGLPTENYAIKVGKSPQEVAEENIKNFRRQLQMFGFSYDWDREINTSSPEYYKWTQWLFIKLYEQGLAYRKKAKVNWCPKDQTVLANEQVAGGKCDRCGSEVEQKEMEQWFLKITDYAEKLLADLNGLDWPESSIKRQKDWIGKSEGAEIDFEILTKEKPNFVLIHGFTGRPDKNFFPWLKKELEGRGYKVQIPELPKTKDPRVYDQVEYVIKNVSFDENTVVLGHSLGSVVALKVIERLGRPVRKTVLVGGFTENRFVGNDNFEPYTFDWKFDVKKINKNVGSLLSLRDLTDDAVPQYQPQKLAEIFDGQLIDFRAEKPHATNSEEPKILRNILDQITVFTTRPDTLFGATYMVLAPEHELVSRVRARVSNWAEIYQYIEQTKRKTELQRQEDVKDKTGIELKGVRAVNPATKEEISVWIADYVLMGYGTGAIMAVPAHDERDFEFAKKFSLPIKQVIAPHCYDNSNPPREDKKTVRRVVVQGVVKHWKEDKVLQVRWKEFPWKTFVIGGAESGESLEEAVKREVIEETGYKNFKSIKKIGGEMRSEWFAAHKGVNRYAEMHVFLLELKDGEQVDLSEEEKKKHDIVWVPFSSIPTSYGPVGELQYIWESLKKEAGVYAGKGVAINSGKFSDLDSEKAKWEITESVGGHKKIQYRLRDWSVSRQRYWGVPIPMIYCDKCDVVPVPEKDLPIELPPLKNYRPKGVPPLASSKEFINIKCPKCGGEAKRAAETLDTFVDSSWYFLRYVDPKNNKEIFDKKKAENWLPVDLYVIGAEHTNLHLLYARFITKFLHDLGYLKFSEPFLKLRHQGLILGEGGQKMSKSKGNVVNPDELVGEFGADTVRLYEMFMGPFEQGQPWDSNGVLGVNRFLYRFWNYFDSILGNKNPNNGESSREIKHIIHKATKKVGEDIESFGFNTAISALMIALNDLGLRNEKPAKAEAEMFLKIAHPFAPHLVQELWENFGNKTILDFEKWPEYDEALTKEEKITLVVQINGKVRDSFEVSSDISDDEAKRLAVGREKIVGLISSKKPKKIIYVVKKLVNIVI